MKLQIPPLFSPRRIAPPIKALVVMLEVVLLRFPGTWDFLVLEY